LVNSVIDDSTVIEIAKKLEEDPAAVLISWAVQRGSSVLPKSVTPSRIESNFQGIHSPSGTGLCQLMILVFTIPDAEFDALDQLDRNQRYNYSAGVLMSLASLGLRKPSDVLRSLLLNRGKVHELNYA